MAKAKLTRPPPKAGERAGKNRSRPEAIEAKALTPARPASSRRLAVNASKKPPGTVSPRPASQPRRPRGRPRTRPLPPPPPKARSVGVICPRCGAPDLLPTLEWAKRLRPTEAAPGPTISLESRRKRLINRVFTCTFCGHRYRHTEMQDDRD